MNNKIHGRGVLIIPREKYLYYGYFKNGERDGFGREFYNE